jgi:cysteine synthase
MLSGEAPPFFRKMADADDGVTSVIRITDAEAVSMARFLVQRDGLFLGSSSAVNLVACVKLVRKMGWGNGEKVVTVLCVIPALSGLSHCPDANDAINISWGCARQINL